MQISMIASSARPNIFRRTYVRMTGHAGIERLFRGGAIPKPRLYYAHRFGRDPEIPDFVDRDVWDVTSIRRGRPFLPNFFQMMTSADPFGDFVFVEDDLAPALNAMERIVTVEIPDEVGVMMFFDYRNEFPSPGLWKHPKPRDLLGSQLYRFPRKHLPSFQRLARDNVIPMHEGSDAWVGQACEQLGLSVATYSPSLVQHLGMLSAYSPGRERPTANNFPGESFDAMGPCPDPVIPGPWEAVTESLYCPLHRKNHDPKDWGRCPVTRTDGSS